MGESFVVFGVTGGAVGGSGTVAAGIVGVEADLGGLGRGSVCGTLAVVDVAADVAALALGTGGADCHRSLSDTSAGGATSRNESSRDSKPVASATSVCVFPSRGMSRLKGAGIAPSVSNRTVAVAGRTATAT